MQPRIKIVGLFTLVTLLLWGGGCAPTGDTRTETQSVELGKAESVRARVDMAFGTLNLSGGASALLEAEFTYNVDKWQPQVEYEISGREGLLRVKQPSVDIPRGNPRYEWALRLNDDVPLDLDVELGAGKSSLDLVGLWLNTLDVQVGAGDAKLDLSGDWRQDVDVSIQGGVGRATVRLPQAVGVRVEVEGALGAINAYGLRVDGRTYTNDAYGQSDVTLYVDVEGGIGEIELKVEE